MAEKEAAERAVKEPNPIIDGRKANVNLAFIGAKPRTNVPQLNSGLITDLYTGFPICPSVSTLRAASAYNPAAALLQAAAVHQYTSAAAAGVNPYLAPYQPYLNAAANPAASLTAAQTAALLQSQHAAAVPQSLTASHSPATGQASTTPGVAGAAGQTSLYYDYPNGQLGAGSESYIPYYSYLNLSYNAAAAAAAASQDRL